MKTQLNFVKISAGRLGTVNFNNMVPVLKEVYTEIEFTLIKDSKYKYLLIEQYEELNKMSSSIYNKSYKLYALYKNDKLPERIQNRCCNFPYLEKVKIGLGEDFYI